jgi:hypothetical protein
MEQKHQQEKHKLQMEIKSTKERLETVKNLNSNLQRVNAKYKKKAEDYDFVSKKCSEIHKAN